MTEPQSPTLFTTPKPSFFGQVVADLRADLRFDRRRLAVAVGAYVLGGAIIGVIWALWAPRERFQTVTGGYAYVNLNAEWQVGGDVVLCLMLSALAVVLTIWIWGWGPRRGLVSLTATVLGSVGAGFVAWLVGTWVTTKPSESDLKTIGAVFAIDQRLHSITTILLPGVIAALLYVVLAMFTGYDGLWRRAEVRRFAAAPVDGPAHAAADAARASCDPTPTAGRPDPPESPRGG